MVAVPSIVVAPFAIATTQSGVFEEAYVCENDAYLYERIRVHSTTFVKRRAAILGFSVDDFFGFLKEASLRATDAAWHATGQRRL